MTALTVVETTSKPFTRTYVVDGQRIVISEVVKFRRAQRYQAFLTVYRLDTGACVGGGFTLLDDVMMYQRAPQLGISRAVAVLIKRDIYDEFRDV